MSACLVAVKNQEATSPCEKDGNKKKSKKRKYEDQATSLENSEYTTTEYADNNEDENFKFTKEKKKKKNKVNLEENNDQTESCIEVLGRKTRLKQIEKPCKRIENTKYETEEFMSFNERSNHADEPNFKTQTKEVKCEIKPYQTQYTSNEKYIKIHVNPEKEICNIPKQVICTEYRLVMAKLTELKIVPPEVKVVIKDALFYPEATRKKLKQYYKSKQFKTLISPKEQQEIEVAVKNLNDQLQSKISMMNTLAEMEESTGQLTQELSKTQLDSGKTSQSECKAEMDPAKVVLLKKMSDVLQSLIRNEIKDTNSSKESASEHLENKELKSSKEKSATSKSTHSKNKNTSSKDITTPKKSSAQLALEERLSSLAEQMKLLTEGKVPLTNNTVKSGVKRMEDRRRFEEEGPMGFGRCKRGAPQNSVFRGGKGGFFSHRNSHQRGYGGTIRAAMPHGGWGALQSFSNSFEKNCNGFNNSTGRNQPFRSKGGFSGGRDFGGRGRISQNNFDAKQYAKKCMAENKMPELNFNGVDLKNISGYAAKISSSGTSKTELSTSTKS
ncbi:uncharacterized protein LOC124372155 [Homalodisca vitripennis]|uniref:uncharacterized protein LOC124372155 n=1 Tax=Homalodisca vitripennis TaxID=197043 RepID=UPI001EECCEF4|nr:uncharacterized protein LOC124372155 [Homalodisca vitripennis]